jgi:hypothetical protein
MTMVRTRTLAFVVATGVVLLFAACDDAAVPEPCSSIPAGGCPLSRGVACEDPTCEAVYYCRPNNVWELKELCPVREAGAANDASVEAEAAAPPSFDASIDAPPGAFGGPGCDSLQSPDCALGLALSCGAGCCGCEDLYICEEGGWTLWGTCADGGVSNGR